MLLAPIFVERLEVLFIELGLWVAGLGWVLTASSIVLSRQIRALRVVGAPKERGEYYQRARYWTQLKVVSILLNLLAALGGLLVFVAILGKVGLIDFSSLEGVPAITGVLTPTFIAFALAINIAVAHLFSLKIPRERPQTGPEAAVVMLGIGAASVFGLMTGVAASVTAPVPIFGEFTDQTAAVFLLAAASMAGFALFFARAMPTIYALFTDEHEFYRGPTHMSRSKSLVMPTAIAFALLFAVLLLFLFFELSLVGLVTDVQSNAVILGIVAFVVIALAVSIYVSFTLSRSEDEAALFREKLSKERTVEVTILAVSGFFVFLFGLGSILVATGAGIPGMDLGHDRWLDLLVFAILSAVGPYGIYYARQRKRIRMLEERFPDFLRDIAASRKAGLTLEASVTIAARGEYGALSPDIQKMADQLSWNVTFEEALQRFSDRVNTPLVERAVSLIIEAGRSGGQVTDVLEAAARDARELKNLENERRLTMTLYTAIVYIAFFVFLGVAAVLYGTFIPEVLKASQAALSTGVSGFGGVSFSTLTLSDYRTFYFVAAIVQSVGNGMIAGMMENSDPLAGLRHSAVMLIISYVIFAFALGLP